MTKEQIEEIALRVAESVNLRLDNACGCSTCRLRNDPPRIKDFAHALLAELAKVGEPVAWLRADGDDIILVKWLSKQPEFIQRHWQKQIPIYTQPLPQPDLVAEQQAHIEMLRDALEACVNAMDLRLDDDDLSFETRMVAEALAATPESYLREHDAKLIESHTPLCEGGVITRQYMIDVAAKIRKGEF